MEEERRKNEWGKKKEWKKRKKDKYRNRKEERLKTKNEVIRLAVIFTPE